MRHKDVRKKKKPLTSREKVMSDVKQSGRRQSRALAALRELVAKSAGMSVNDVICANYLIEYGEATPGELAKITGIGTSAISGVITRLENLGQVTSERSTEDKRQIVLRPRLSKMTWYNKHYGGILKDLDKLYASYSLKELKLIARYQYGVGRILLSRIEEF